MIYFENISQLKKTAKKQFRRRFLLTAEINNEHAFILCSHQVGLLHVYMLAIKKKCFSNVCINVLLGLRGAWKNLLLGLYPMQKHIFPASISSFIKGTLYIVGKLLNPHDVEIFLNKPWRFFSI